MPIKKSPLTFNCQKCSETVEVKFCPPLKEYVRKNNWGYWTEKEENKDKYICDDCLMKLYRLHKWEFHQLISNKNKKLLFRQYVARKVIRGKVEAVFIRNLDKTDKIKPPYDLTKIPTDILKEELKRRGES